MISSIIAKLYQDLKIRIIQVNQTAKTPPLPYGVYNMTSPYIKGVGQPDVYTYVDENGWSMKSSDEYLMTISFNIYAATNNEAMEWVIKVREWFNEQGYYTLQDENLVVANLGNVENRTTFLVDSYEYKFGFDVQLRTNGERLIGNLVQEPTPGDPNNPPPGEPGNDPDKDPVNYDWIEYVELQMKE